MESSEVFSGDKYILIKTDIFKAWNRPVPTNAVDLAELIKVHPEAVIFNKEDDPDEFFVIMLKDKFARSAIIQYARAAALYGRRQLGSFVQSLAERAGHMSKYCKDPD